MKAEAASPPPEEATIDFIVMEARDTYDTRHRMGTELTLTNLSADEATVDIYGARLIHQVRGPARREKSEPKSLQQPTGKVISTRTMDLAASEALEGMAYEEVQRTPEAAEGTGLQRKEAKDVTICLNGCPVDPVTLMPGETITLRDDSDYEDLKIWGASGLLIDVDETTADPADILVTARQYHDDGPITQLGDYMPVLGPEDTLSIGLKAYAPLVSNWGNLVQEEGWQNALILYNTELDTTQDPTEVEVTLLNSNGNVIIDANGNEARRTFEVYPNTRRTIHGLEGYFIVPDDVSMDDAQLSIVPLGEKILAGVKHHDNASGDEYLIPFTSKSAVPTGSRVFPGVTTNENWRTAIQTMNLDQGENNVDYYLWERNSTNPSPTHFYDIILGSLDTHSWGNIGDLFPGVDEFQGALEYNDDGNSITTVRKERDSPNGGTLGHLIREATLDEAFGGANERPAHLIGLSHNGVDNTDVEVFSWDGQNGTDITFELYDSDGVLLGTYDDTIPRNGHKTYWNMLDTHFGVSGIENARLIIKNDFDGISGYPGADKFAAGAVRKNVQSGDTSYQAAMSPVPADVDPGYEGDYEMTARLRYVGPNGELWYSEGTTIDQEAIRSIFGEADLEEYLGFNTLSLNNTNATYEDLNNAIMNMYYVLDPSQVEDMFGDKFGDTWDPYFRDATDDADGDGWHIDTMGDGSDWPYDSNGNESNGAVRALEVLEIRRLE